MTGLPRNHIITTTSKGKLGGRGQNERIELPGAVETDGLGKIKKPPKPCRNGHDKAQMAGEILTGELPPTPRRPPDYVQRTMKHELKDRFEAGENPCDRCKWMDAVTDAEWFPCSHCIHNNAIDRTTKNG